MQLIPLDSHGAHADDRAAMDALSSVIGSVGDPAFGNSALQALNRWMPLCWWSVYTLYAAAPPVLHAHSSVGDAPRGTSESWRVYRSSLYRRDGSFSAARQAVATGAPALVHWMADELPPEHREAIYSRNGLRERLSIVAAASGGGLLAINLYRHERQAPLGTQALQAAAGLAQPLVACVERHITLRARDGGKLAGLQELTQREREVCERLLKGWTHDGIAADLGLTPATVRTYRDRAFQRIGVRSRHELFARFSQAGA
ncbi:LuxR family transcriptional regulator [Ramlibacter sp. AW1]|uniref:LuxR family transcriptional regulator n=1 Tax=Ramlibacter aurantiacus TaxID=2801330 RepID=A0A936ZNB6_9BURK|nr:LuxR C-terminal-related transcriptional regulator [Ramlibacter aurantiacus]MBL0419381.1 LuxR family transcriptional regulator [Ramlibacter aurantiacus]